MRHFAKLFIAPVLFSLAVEASDTSSPSFDDVIFDSELVEAFVPMGFGGLKVLDMLSDEKVRPTYEKFRSYGRVSVGVKKIAAKNLHESNRNVYLFEAWQHQGFTGRKLTATWQIESYQNRLIADHAPTEYEVGEITFP